MADALECWTVVHGSSESRRSSTSEPVDDRLRSLDCFWCGERHVFVAGDKIVCSGCAASYDRATYESSLS